MIRWRACLWHPVWILIGLVPLTQWAQDEWYPLSAFPMYAKNDRESHLVYLADARGEPISLVRYGNLTCAKATKLYRTLLRDECLRRKIRITTAPLEVHQAAAGRLMDALRTLSRDHGREPLPDDAGIVFLDLKFDGTRIVQETTRLTRP